MVVGGDLLVVLGGRNVVVLGVWLYFWVSLNSTFILLSTSFIAGGMDSVSKLWSSDALGPLVVPSPMSLFISHS